MKISDYSYPLPDELIADQPPEIRGSSRLLVMHRESGSLIDARYLDVAAYLNNGDLLILNDTRVIKARLLAKKVNGIERELIVLEKHGHRDNWHTHKVMYRRTLREGEQLSIGDAEITVEKILGDGLAIVNSSCDLLDMTQAYGQVPLPPYMHRKATPTDIERYQTIWAKQ